MVKSSWDKQKVNNKYTKFNADLKIKEDKRKKDKLLPFEVFEKKMQTKTNEEKQKQINLTDYVDKTSTKPVKQPEDNEWVSELSIIDNPVINVPNNIRLICDKIQEEFPGIEFSIMVKGDYTPQGFTLTEDYIIPIQKISGAEVLYEELTQYQRAGYNTVIHSHHNMGGRFSEKDKNYINCQNPCSILYNHQGFPMATLSFKQGNNIFLMETTQIKTIIENNIEVVGIENITKKVIKAPIQKLIKTDDKPFDLNDPLYEFSYFDNELEVEYCKDGVHAIVNGYKMTLDELEQCEVCQFACPEYCKQCLSTTDIIKISESA